MQKEPEFYYGALLLTGICILVFFLQVIIQDLTPELALVSSDVLIRPWTLVTSIFGHLSLGHLLMNMFGLALFGSILERHIGTKRFLLVFFLSGIFSGIVGSFYYEATLGASGAVFGILGALATLRPGMIVWVSFVPMPMILAAAVWAFLEYMASFTPGNVANISHLTGLGLGIIIGIIFRLTIPKIKTKKRKITPDEERELDEYERMHKLRR